jgi:hypothetical protein
MKKTIQSLFAMAVAAFALTACSDVPMPEGYNPNQGDQVIDFNPTGSGTKTDPYTTADAISYAKSLNMKESTDAVYIKGKVSKVETTFGASGTYGNAVFYISDDGNADNKSEQFYVYRALYLGNKKFQSGDTDIKVGDDVIVYGKVVNYKGNTPETVSGTAYLYSLNGKAVDTGDEGEVVPGDPKGSGTENDPYNVAAAVKKCQEIGTEVPSEKYYVKGIVDADATPDASFGNATFYLVDEEGASEKFYCFQVLGSDGQKMPATYTIKKGSEVIVYGPIYNYKGNTPETASKGAAYIVTVNGNKTEVIGGNVEPTPTGDEGTPITAGRYFFVYKSAGSVQVGKPVDADKSFGYMYLTDAKVTDSKLDNDEANLFTFTSVDGGFTIQDASGRYYYMDGEHKSFQVSATMPSSNHIWTATTTNDGTATVKNVGTGLTIQYLSKYKEFTPTDNGDGLPLLLQPGATVEVSGGDNTGGDNTGGGEVSGNSVSVTMSSLGLANGTDMGTVTLSDGTTLTFEAGGNKNGPKYYNTGTAARMYPSNTMTINAGSKKIAAIEIACNEYNGTIYNASGDITVDGTKMTADGATLKFAGPNASVATVTNTSTTTGAPSQLYIVTLKISYAN